MSRGRRGVVPGPAGLALAALALAALTLTACTMASGPVLPSTPARPDRHNVVFLGDSLTAGLGVDPAARFTSLIQAFWTRKGIPYTAVNEGISGDTTADVLERLVASAAPSAELTILEIGANDAFQGVPVETITANMRRIIQVIKRGGSRVAMSAMYFGPGFLPQSDEYARRFDAIYAEVGRAEKVPVLPHLLRSLFTRADLWLEDGVHPTEEGHALVARDLLADLNPGWKLQGGGRATARNP